LEYVSQLEYATISPPNICEVGPGIFLFIF